MTPEKLNELFKHHNEMHVLELSLTKLDKLQTSGEAVKILVGSVKSSSVLGSDITTFISEDLAKKVFNEALKNMKERLAVMKQEFEDM